MNLPFQEQLKLLVCIPGINKICFPLESPNFVSGFGRPEHTDDWTVLQVRKEAASAYVHANTSDQAVAQQVRSVCIAKWKLTYSFAPSESVLGQNREQIWLPAWYLLTGADRGGKSRPVSAWKGEDDYSFQQLSTVNYLKLNMKLHLKSQERWIQETPALCQQNSALWHAINIRLRFRDIVMHPDPLSQKGSEIYTLFRLWNTFLTVSSPLFPSLLSLKKQ